MGSTYLGPRHNGQLDGHAQIIGAHGRILEGRRGQGHTCGGDLCPVSLASPANGLLAEVCELLRL